MVTPFDGDGKLDLKVAAQLAQWLVANGHDGLVIAGTTGEAPTLTHEEQAELIAAVVDAVDVPVVAGAGSNDTRSAVKNTAAAAGAGAAAILSVSPYYNRPSQAGIKAHFKAVAQSTDLPVVLYDVPARTGRKVEIDTILELAHDVANIVALKDAAANPAETAVMMSQAPADFELYSGDDGLTLAFMALGACGTIGVATHWTGAEQQAMFAAFERGDVAEARRINAALQLSYAFITSPATPSPQPTKAMMRVLGIPVGYPRPPMDQEPADLEQAARAVLATTSLANAG
jgi:4-hydroxy-tetrahydrodipicolinate synthase